MVSREKKNRSEIKQEKKEYKRRKILDRKRLNDSFKYAYEGIKTTYKKEQNLRIHIIAACLVVIFGFLLKINKVEWITCIILIGLVIASECINTAIESTIDLVTDKYHPLAKTSKDTAAAGVLILAITAFIIGCIIFVPKIIIVIGELS